MEKQQTPLGYSVGDKLVIAERLLPVVVTQIYLDTSWGLPGVWQVVVTDPASGHDVFRATDAEIRQHCFRMVA